MGKIYILTNDAMPNIIKIGSTEKNIEDRIKEFDTTGVPLPFRCHYAIEIENQLEKEKYIHDAFSDHRLRKNREFFELAPERAVSILKAIGGREISIEGNVMIGEEGSTISDGSIPIIIKKSPINLFLLGIKPGDKLIFTRDENKYCKVLSERKVEYEKKEYSLSALAARLLKENNSINYNNRSVQGTLYFKFKNEILTEFREKLEQEFE
ncbi:MAG: GIY-YIG nuclease family protein [Candidatus Paraimprobicoccus trichonymphae]|uniref:GIY-YIG nuclease family protein n=1 Tax=Candidatus Paraimprobicoccus trichonymphae TaxID=3033793 RepID=A0AA48IBP1_9FIRM|nr:MAG: GIY-YIG nuclease family protein [Candidatus Paraimprobicoccus trichonymphae]